MPYHLAIALSCLFDNNEIIYDLLKKIKSFFVFLSDTFFRLPPGGRIPAFTVFFMGFLPDFCGILIIIQKIHHAEAL